MSYSIVKPTHHIVEHNHVHISLFALTSFTRKSQVVTDCTILTINYINSTYHILKHMLWKKLKVIYLHDLTNLHMLLPKNLLRFETGEEYNTQVKLTKKMLVVILSSNYVEPIDLTKNLQVICILSRIYNQTIELPKNLKYFRFESVYIPNTLFPNHLVFMKIIGKRNAPCDVVFPEYLRILGYGGHGRAQITGTLGQNIHTVIINGKWDPYKYANLPNRTQCLSQYPFCTNHKQIINNERDKFENYMKKILGVDTFNYATI